MDRTYEHFPIEETEFRLAVIQPADIGSEYMHCRIISTKDFTTQYEALSYVWGDPTQLARILVDGQPYPIPRNLHKALHSLRLEDKERTLWIDVICINQMDVRERNHQVQMMQDIYQHAVRVCIWLGEKDESSSLAMRFIENVGHVSDLDSIIRDPRFEKEWRAAIQLLSLPWFSRIWVVQEISVARKATIWCGNDTIDWQHFASFVELLLHKAHISTEYMPFVDFGARRLVSIVNQVFKRNDLGEIQGLSLSLEILVTMLSSFKSADARDRIYALLGLANDIDSGRTLTRESRNIQNSPSELFTSDENETLSTQESEIWSINDMDVYSSDQINIGIDYGKPLAQLCDDFICFAITKSGTLDILFRPWAPNDRNLPSWICTTDHLPYELHGDVGSIEAVRVNADPYVSPAWQSPTYSASGTLRVQKGWAVSRNEDGNSSLRIKGVVVDMIDTIAPTAWGGKVPTEWLEFSEKRPIEDNDELLHTLVAGRGPQGNMCPPYYHDAFISTVQGIGDIDFIDVNQIQLDNPGSIEGEFWSRAQAVIWDRSLIKTRHGRLGMVPSLAKKGDCELKFNSSNIF